MRTGRYRGFTLAMAGVCLLTVASAEAKVTPEQQCEKGRYSAAAEYSACQQKALAKLFGSKSNVDNFNKFEAASGKCQTKYTAVWPKLQAKAPGSACDTGRFTDNGTTVTDNLTGLQWEKKQNLDSTQNFADPHDADNTYSWTATPPFTAADGTAFATFLPALNSGGCFAGQCDWRLPTIYELKTLLQAPSLCGTSPCIDAVFGPTVAFNYWSATTSATNPSLVWYVNFFSGLVFSNVYKPNNYYVRAVRAGL